MGVPPPKILTSLFLKLAHTYRYSNEREWFTEFRTGFKIKIHPIGLKILAFKVFTFSAFYGFLPYFGFSPIKCLFGGKYCSFWSIFVGRLPAWHWAKKKAKSYVREVTPPRKVSPSDPQAGIKSLISPKFQPFYIWTKHSQLYTQIDQYNALSTELLSKSKSTQ